MHFTKKPFTDKLFTCLILITRGSMKTLFIRSSFILMSTASIFAEFANEESFEQRVGYVKTHLAMLYAAKRPISLSVTTDADKICLNINGSNVDNCFSREELSSFLIEKYKESAAKRDEDICDKIRQLKDHNLPIGKATLSLDLEAASIDFALNTPEKELLSFKGDTKTDNCRRTLRINETIEISATGSYDMSNFAKKGLLDEAQFKVKALRNDNTISVNLKGNRNEYSTYIQAFIANVVKGSYFLHYDQKNQKLIDCSVQLQNPKSK